MGVLMSLSLVGCLDDSDQNSNGTGGEMMDEEISGDDLANLTLSEYRETRSIDDTLASLLAFYQAHHPGAVESLNPPATAAQLDQLEAVIGQPLPADFRALYELANGQDSDTDAPLFPEGFTLLSIDEIIAQWQLSGAVATEEALDEAYSTAGVVAEAWWIAGWIPFAGHIRGDSLCIDLAPGKRGVRGQVIDWWHDDASRPQLANSLNDYLGELDTELRRGRYVIDDGVVMDAAFVESESDGG